MSHAPWSASLGFLLAGVAASQGPVRFAPEGRDSRPVSFLGATAAVVNWDTAQPCPTRIQLREGSFPAGTPGYEKVWDGAREIAGLTEKTRSHSIMLQGLEPARRYYYRVYDPGHEAAGEGERQAARLWSAEPPWSRERAFATAAGPGRKAILRIPVKVLLVPNVVDFATLAADSPVPEAMSEAEIRMYRRELRQAALFYWVNSGMRYWIDLDFFVEPQWQRLGAETEGLDAFYRGWPALRGGLRVFDSADVANHRAAWPLKEKRIYTGQVVVRCTRRWNRRRRQWVYQRSGGGTFGVDWMGWRDATQRPAPGRSSFLGGSDTAWLMSHEFKHQLESQYKLSGLDREQDRVIFCHYAPRFTPPIGKAWRWCTAFSHGRHFDGLAYQLRALTPLQYMRNMFGEVVATQDADGDGVPDDDPRLPLDEKRFGSDPHMASTDGSGVTDLVKIRFAKWIPAVNTPSRDKRFYPVYRTLWRLASGERIGPRAGRPGGAVAPSPTAADSDGDGLADADDPYPIYPWPPVIRRATVQVDGELADWREVPLAGRLATPDLGVTVRTAYDHDFLYYAFECEGRPASLELVVDADADGYTAGNDNLRLFFTPAAIRGDPGPGRRPPATAALDPHGRWILREVGIHMAADRSWPHWDNGRPLVTRPGQGREGWEFQRPKVYGGWRDIRCASATTATGRTLEIAIPNGTGKMPVQVGPAHTVAISINVGLDGGGTLSVYEPWTLFRTTAE